ncbi:tripeptide aminopeptidase [Geothermobacter ehrlichii]|uniref:Tripeptide aminopeptidase n=1 Tax=Geothermobacter ehrlichii TaxID=213224 RepID=A0A5D3WK34_9BACT|nr:M20/M25/M40 family metallo-hydrolase [Geothermobacter ehrlichii]TYO98714.1 tripeptide aminopeptidase [Geothermobacter ehrlichii]
MRVNQQAIIEEFARQAAIASPSKREGAMAAYLTERFRRLGGEVSMDDAGERVGGEVGNLLVRLPGTRAGEPLLLSVHMDTVSPCEGVEPVLVDGVFRSAGETVLGADDKAGIVELIEALETVRRLGIGHPPLEIVITVCEEIGLAGAKHFDVSRLTARRGYAFDTNGVDRLIHRAPGSNRLRITIDGREAHAGIAPEKGLSAIEVAARAIAAMPLGRIDEETTANIGTIEGGIARNIVPRTVRMEGEARSHSSRRLEEQTRAMLEAVERAADATSRQIDGERVRARIEADVWLDYPIMHVPVEAEVIRLAAGAAAGLGRSLEVGTAGGGSDANIFNQAGIETVILGTGMERVHTVDEQVRVADMAAVAELLVEILARA